MESTKVRRWHLILLGAILAIAAVARWHKIDSASFWIDEFLSLEVSSGHGYEHCDFPQGVLFTPSPGLTGHNADGSWKNLFLSLRRTNHPPLYFCVLRVWETLLNTNSDLALRGLSALFSLAAIVLAFDAARLLHGTTTALFAAAVMALAAPQIQYAQEARAYAMLVAVMMACCCLLVRIEVLGTSRQRLIALFFCTMAMLLTQYLAFAILAALIVYAIIRLRGTGASWTLAAAAIWMLVLWGPTMQAQLAQPVSNLSWMTQAGHDAGRATLVRLALLPLRFFVNPGPKPPGLACLGIILFALPALMLKRRPDLLLWSIILWITTFTIVAGDLVRSTSALSVLRYTLAGAATANVLVVAIASSLIPRRPLIAPALVAAACALALPNSYDRDKADFRTLADFLDHRCTADSVLVCYADPRFEWYPGIVALGLSHYCHAANRPTLLLVNRADDKIVRQLAGHQPVDVVWNSDSLPPILPGCHILEQQMFPFVGQCARVAWPPEHASAGKQAGTAAASPGSRPNHT